ncbi:MAG: hypothetical protein E4H00_06145 [Myxococcales bacterium]|nr:MAG: hypothetical protein E4H00_06145 [Myxococcales bacterium]
MTTVYKAKRKGMSQQKRLNQLRDTYHFHGCQVCFRPYEDRCAMPEADSVCRVCRGVNVPEWERDEYPANRYAKSCCERSAPLLDQESLRRYRCAGSGGWWICLTCQRIRPARSARG